MKAHCPECERARPPRDSLRDGSPARELVGKLDDGTAVYRYRVRLDVHPDGAGGVCSGSGRLV